MVEPVVVHHWHVRAFWYGLLAVGAFMGTAGAWFWPSRRSSRPKLPRLWFMGIGAGVAGGTSVLAVDTI
ncbi:MAG: hypothetical protein M0Z53_15730 [Thermaerobacter sp.]|nr:hypothetical protein [Thermaerobacter sp.]